MTPRRPIAVSTAPYDGYPAPEAFDSIAACGGQAVEPAFIVGYTEPFDETAFSPLATRTYQRWLGASGLDCPMVSSHIDLGRPDAIEVFARRMDFARAIGASVIATNAAVRDNEAAFFRHIDVLARHGERIGLVIGLENPGDGRDNLVNTAADGLRLVERLGSRFVRLNYDAGNTASHAPDGPVPSADAIRALPACASMHVKDVRRTAAGWFFTPLGDGEIGCGAILAELGKRPSMPFGIELPLRLYRGPDAQPVRRRYPVPLAEIEAAVTRSLAFVDASLGSLATTDADDGAAGETGSVGLA